MEELSPFVASSEKDSATSMPLPISQEEATELIGRIWTLLKNVIDPEMHVNIVDLGLVYHLTLQREDPSPPPKSKKFFKFFQKKSDLPKQEPGCKVVIEMTLTSPSCPMGPYLFSSIYRTLEGLPHVTSVDIGLVWEPPWSQEKISEAGKMEMGLL